MNKNEFVTRFCYRPLSTAQSQQTLLRSQVEKRSSLKPAAVLVALKKVPTEDNSDSLSIVLTKRALHLRHHPGQIAFPGGKHENTDKSLFDTALRETYEEIGVAKENVEILGSLANYQTVSGFIVTPILALLHAETKFKLDKNEVAELIEIPISYFTQAEQQESSRFESVSSYFQGIKREVIFAQYKHHHIWGATASMLYDLIKHVSK